MFVLPQIEIKCNIIVKYNFFPLIVKIVLAYEKQSRKSSLYYQSNTLSPSFK